MDEKEAGNAAIKAIGAISGWGSDFAQEREAERAREKRDDERREEALAASVRQIDAYVEDAKHGQAHRDAIMVEFRAQTEAAKSQADALQRIAASLETLTKAKAS